MKDKTFRMQRFKNNPKNFPFLNKENEENINKKQGNKRKRKLPIRFKKSAEMQRTYDSVSRKNPVNVSGITRQQNMDSMNLLTAPTQILLNSMITSLLSFKKGEGFLLPKSLMKIDFDNKVLSEEEKKEQKLLGYNQTKDLANRKFTWNDVDWDFVKTKYPDVMNSVNNLLDTASNEQQKLLKFGFPLEKIIPSSDDGEIKKAFELVHAKGQDLLKNVFTEHSKDINADVGEIGNVKSFIAQLNAESGRKMSPVEMLTNIIVLKLAKGENADKEIEGLFNHTKNENSELNIRGSVSKMHKAIDKAVEKGVLVVSKSIEVAGKAMEATGQGIQAVGKTLQAVPVVGNVVGSAIIAGGTAVEGSGKAVGKAGESMGEVAKEKSKAKKILNDKDLKINPIQKMKEQIGKVFNEINRTDERTPEPQQESSLMR